jgi:putative component of membrane protein insertase Oxa1/YidC/SpoIIIJ protein YidD
MILKTCRVIALICLNSLLWQVGRAQSRAEKTALSQQLLPRPAKVIYKEATQNRNEIQTVFSGFFLMYKNFFSSQDSYRCTFHPSCSEYGLIAVKQLGATRGMLSTFDRLVRCNGLSPEKYTIDMERNVLIDNVEAK